MTPSFAVSLLKRFLKELPEQLIPTENSSAMFKIINDPGNDTNRFNDLRNIIQKIPKSNRDTIRLLFLHMHDIIHRSNTISPTQTSSKTNESSFIPMTIAQLIKSKERTVKYLVQHATDLFERPTATQYVEHFVRKKNLHCFRLSQGDFDEKSLAFVTSFRDNRVTKSKKIDLLEFVRFI